MDFLPSTADELINHGSLLVDDAAGLARFAGA